MHRKFPSLGALVLGLVVLAGAFAGMTRAAQYSGANRPGLQFVQSEKPAAGGVKIAENASPASHDGDAEADEARKRLKKELDRMRKTAQGSVAAPPAPPQPPAKKKDQVSKAPGTAERQPLKRPAPSQAVKGEEAATQSLPSPPAGGDAGLNHTLGKLILMRFSGAEASENGPKAVKALMHEGLIAGVMFGADNIQSKPQLRELMKFLSQGTAKPYFAIAETGGAESAFPRIKDFESWPSERDVAGKGDPDYAYLTYRSLGNALAGLGFNLNFGPVLGSEQAERDPSASFGDNPLQAGVFAKTFTLGHRDSDMLAVPVVDRSDLAVRSLKSLLISSPGMPIALSVTGEGEPFAPFDGLVKGPRFCFPAADEHSAPIELAGLFNRGCDAIIIDAAKENPAVLRERLALGVSNAVKTGALAADVLNAAVQRVSALRPSPASAPVFTTRTAQ